MRLSETEAKSVFDAIRTTPSFAELPPIRFRIGVENPLLATLGASAAFVSPDGTFMCERAKPFSKIARAMAKPTARVIVETAGRGKLAIACLAALPILPFAIAAAPVAAIAYALGLTIPIGIIGDSQKEKIGAGIIAAISMLAAIPLIIVSWPPIIILGGIVSKILPKTSIEFIVPSKS
jgi:hypothetical protein